MDIIHELAVDKRRTITAIIALQGVSPKQAAGMSGD
jgi:hypothetical protein